MAGKHDIHDQRLLIIDFGAQYTQLIARRVREAGVYCEIHPFDVPEEFIRDFAPRGVILSGGPESVTFGDTPRIPSIVFELGVPILGICYGLQLTTYLLDGEVVASSEREYGYAELEVLEGGDLFSGAPTLQKVWMSHGDKVKALPSGFKLSLIHI